MVAVPNMALSEVVATTVLRDTLLYEGAQATLQHLAKHPQQSLDAYEATIPHLNALHAQLSRAGVSMRVPATALQCFSYFVRRGNATTASGILENILRDGLSFIPTDIYTAAAAEAGFQVFEEVQARLSAAPALAERRRAAMLQVREAKMSLLIESAQGLNEATHILIQESQLSPYPFTSAQILRLLEKAETDRDLYQVVHPQTLRFPSLFESGHVPGLLKMAMALENRLSPFLQRLVQSQTDQDIFAKHLQAFVAHAKFSEEVALALENYRVLHPEHFPKPSPAKGSLLSRILSFSL
ncbi:MAG: hypothetical protein Q7S68_05265 [Deltaproteobacteria bacterium]|nr:hypothetical protein [Deltaproteobacteria bacterium]